MVSIWTIALFLLGAVQGEKQHAYPLEKLKLKVSALPQKALDVTRLPAPWDNSF